ncbi:putative phosphoenolpyruvate phosphomutase [Methylorubrum populi]|jgi:hypothetical protein|uniref:Putative phosphoenolpyruvate phosphomutase n=1 Tax=Methylorubrum populi TaxID=223967 RepID=A0A169QC62_9HYPH|nr:hypothetical protein [Methylorubrum populi]BAU88683.1 putative phosphoenolpyruvate phosphomutase [Methylorubrum populi]
MTQEKPNVLTQEEAKKTLSDLLSAFRFLEAAAPDITVEGFKALLVVALTSWGNDLVRLPDVTKVSKVLDKSPSRASRLAGALSDPEGLALVEARSGLSGTRSESLIITDHGKALVSSFLEVLTDRRIEELPFQNFEGLQGAKNSARSSKKEKEIYLKQSEYDKETLTLKVGPKSDVFSDEVRNWCLDNLSAPPMMVPDAEEVLISFAKVSDAVYFKLQWCW